jgi:rhamnose transport system substrate-binding protein
MRREFSRIVRIVGLLAVALTVIGFIASCAKPVSKDYAIVFKNTGNPYGDKQMSGFKTGIEEQGFKAIL